MNPYQVGVLILIGVFINWIILESGKRTRAYISELSKRTRAHSEDTIIDIENSGEETRAKLRELSKQITSGEDKTLSYGQMLREAGSGG